MRIKLCALALALLCCLAGKSQFLVDPITPDEAVEILVGEGVVYSNVSFTGDPLQIGYFSGADNTDFEIPSGIVLCTEDVETMEVGAAGTFLTSPVSGNADLLAIANSVPPLIGQSFSVSSANDVAILEFDFIPNGDSLVFNYVFGSDEYLTWVNSSYNDVFAFFIAGPGISGPYDAPAGFPDGSMNIAFIPETDPQIPITISSVNNQLNSEYYIDNPSQLDVALNGYTVSLQAYAPVQCGQTYHIILAIADGTDTALKSSVAFEEGSFSSNGAVDVHVSNPPIPDWPQGLLAEGCIYGSFEVFESDTATLDTLIMWYGGTATNGIDYEFLSDTVIIPQGQTSVMIDIVPLDDAIFEGEETFTISFPFYNDCEELDTAFAEVTIVEQLPITFNNMPDLVICADETQQVTAIPQGGFAPYNFVWNSGPLTPTVTVDNYQTYEVTVTDFCDQQASASFDVTPPAPPSVSVASDELFVCPNSVETIDATASEGTPPYFYSWTSSVSSSATGSFEFEDAGWQYVTVTDDCGQSAMDSVEIVVPGPITGDTLRSLCTEVFTGSLVDGGAIPYYYYYDSTAFSFDHETILTSHEIGYYDVIVMDACGQTFYLSIDVHACDTQLPNIFTPNGDGDNDTFEVKGGHDFPGSRMIIYNRWGNVVYENDNYVGQWSGDENAAGTYFYIYQRADGKNYSGWVQLMKEE